MNINLANIDFCPGGKSATLTETTAEILLTETEKVIVPPEGTDGFNKVTITHAPVEESVSATITSNGTHTITPSEGFGAMFGVSVDVNVPSNNYDIGSSEWVKDMKNKCVELETSDNDQRAYILPQYASIVDGDGVIPKKNNNNENILDANGNIIYEGDLILPRSNYEYYPLRDDELINTFTSKEYSNLYGTFYSVYKIQSQNTIGVRYPFFSSQTETYYVPATIFPVMYDAFRENKTIFGIENAIMLGRFSGTGTHEDPIELQSDQYWDVPKFQKNICNREGVEFGGWIKVSEQALIDSIFPYDFPSIEISVTTGYYSPNRSVSPLPNIITKINKIEITGKNINFNYFCKDLTKLSTIYEFDSSNVINMDLMFQGCTSLVSLPKIDATKLTNSTTMFGYTYEDLPNLTTLGGFTGLKINLVLAPCSNLTHDSLMNVINEAADVTSSPKTLTLGTTNLNKLTDEEKAIATNKGWTLA